MNKPIPWLLPLFSLVCGFLIILWIGSLGEAVLVLPFLPVFGLMFILYGCLGLLAAVVNQATTNVDVKDADKKTIVSTALLGLFIVTLIIHVSGA